MHQENSVRLNPSVCYPCPVTCKEQICDWSHLNSSLPLSILHLAVSWERHLLVHTSLEGKASLKDKNALHLYSVNGKHLASEPLQEQVTDMSVSQEYGVVGNRKANMSANFTLAQIRWADYGNISDPVILS
ncbi:neurobeachin-like protein 1 [Gadus macrocephalus]|uniref:neurobeachin-like protein 1 n=1 Tax=Gadus macrocephalus TaxID=80720 RepID=UPI0028CBAFEA|nr:neurobeachin-like protein 1 [Gadus macrocephalus]